MNTYGYVGGNPLGYVDPFGLQDASLRGRVEAVITAGWNDASKAADIGKKVRDSTANSGLPGSIPNIGIMTNSPADAYKHCVWSCKLNRSDIPSDQVSALLEVWENEGDRAGQSKGQRKMDENNNSAGAMCSKLKGSCENNCLNSLKSGQLFGVGGKKNRFPKEWRVK